ncbi:MAG: Crp/Fnr family transcriptional regulator [Acidobacteria bacterium]|nr:Crp/Fnr family transcriptional regulator [Acidobacteriota bacterium]
MRNNTLDSTIPENRLLKTLPPKDYELILSRMDRIEVRQGDLIYEFRQDIEYVYFPTTAVFSWLVLTEAGDMIEVGISDGESMAGIAIFLENRTSLFQVRVQLSGTVLRMKAEPFKVLCEGLKSLQKRLNQYTYLMLSQFIQSAVCNRFHTVEQRLSRWLLTARDRSQSDILPLTKEILAAMIGARRPAVSIVVNKLQSEGWLRSHRGKIIITNRHGLEQAACECYAIVKGDLTDFLNAKV